MDRSQVLRSMGFSRQEYWSGLSRPSPEDFPDPGIKPASPALQADSLPTELPGKPVKFGYHSGQQWRLAEGFSRTGKVLILGQGACHPAVLPW